MERKTIESEGTWKTEKFSYWVRFDELHPDKSYIESLAAKNPFYKSIIDFCLPVIFETDPDQYPFDAKMKELPTIYKKEDSFFDKVIRTKGIEKDWLQYFKNLFLVTKGILNNKEWFDRSLSKDPRFSPSREWKKEAVNLIIRIVSLHSVEIRTSTNGDGKWFIDNGCYWPFWIIRHHGKRIASESKTLHETEVHFKKPWSEEKINKSFDWDFYSVCLFQKYGECGYDYLFDSETRIYRIGHYYNGKPIGKPFQVQIAKRYEPLLNSCLKKYGGLIKELLSSVKIDIKDLMPLFYEAVKKYDPSSGAPPVAYFKKQLSYEISNFYDRHSSEAGDRPCDPFCKEGKRERQELPCEYETSSGFCINSTKKRRSKYSLEHSGGSLDDFINPDDGDAGRRIDSFEDLNILDPESTLITKEIVEKVGVRSGFEAMTSAERKRKERKIKEAKKFEN